MSSGKKKPNPEPKSDPKPRVKKQETPKLLLFAPEPSAPLRAARVEVLDLKVTGLALKTFLEESAWRMTVIVSHSEEIDAVCGRIGMELRKESKKGNLWLWVNE